MGDISQWQMLCFGCNQKAAQGIELRETLYDNKQVSQKETDNFVMQADKNKMTKEVHPNRI
jgi:hypothetical protein